MPLGVLRGTAGGSQKKQEESASRNTELSSASGGIYLLDSSVHALTLHWNDAQAHVSHSVMGMCTLLMFILLMFMFTLQNRRCLWRGTQPRVSRGGSLHYGTRWRTTDLADWRLVNTKVMWRSSLDRHVLISSWWMCWFMALWTLSSGSETLKCGFLGTNISWIYAVGGSEFLSPTVSSLCRVKNWRSSYWNAIHCFHIVFLLLSLSLKGLIPRENVYYSSFWNTIGHSSGVHMHAEREHVLLPPYCLCTGVHKIIM